MGEVVEQIVRPTGLLDSTHRSARPSLNQIDDLMGGNQRTGKNRWTNPGNDPLPSEWPKNLLNILPNSISTSHIHSEVLTMDRVEILRDLRLGNFDVLVGVNLLREGLIFRKYPWWRSSMQIKKAFFVMPGHLPRRQVGLPHSNGRVIFYADKITDSMQRTMDETERRRAKQITYNEEMHHTTILAKLKTKFLQRSILDFQNKTKAYRAGWYYTHCSRSGLYMGRDQIENS